MNNERLIIAITALLSFTVLTFIYFGDPEISFTLTREDGLIEGLTAVLYAIGLAACIFTAQKTQWRAALPIIWIFLCFVFLGEETSWLQRQLDYSVPAIEQVNAQNEFNLHNLQIFQGGNLTEGSFEVSSLLKSQNIFRLGFFGYFLIIPLLIKQRDLGRLADDVGYRTQNRAFPLTIIAIFIFSFGLTLIAPKGLKSSIAETREMLYAFFIAIYILTYVLPLRNNHSTQQ